MYHCTIQLRFSNPVPRHRQFPYYQNQNPKITNFLFQKNLSGHSHHQNIESPLSYSTVLYISNIFDSGMRCRSTVTNYGGPRAPGGAICVKWVVCEYYIEIF